MRKIANNRITEEVLSQTLIQAGLISKEQLKEAVEQNKVSDRYLEDIFVNRGWVKPETILYLKENAIAPTSAHHNAELQENLKLNNLYLNFSAKFVLGIMLKIIFFLVIAHCITQLAVRLIPDFFLRDGFARLFYLDSELNFPALYSALALFVSALIIGLITYLKREVNDPYTNYWQWLGIIFAFLSFDELVSLHEQMIPPVKALVNTRGFLYFAWVIPGGIGVLIFLLIFFKFIFNLPRTTRNHFLIAGCLYISGCIGCELVGGYLVDHQVNFIFYFIVMTLEETLEMLGIAVFVYGLLSHISSYTKGANLQLEIPGTKIKLIGNQPRGR